MTQTYFNILMNKIYKEKADLHAIPNDFISANEGRNFLDLLSKHFYFFGFPTSLCLCENCPPPPPVASIFLHSLSCTWVQESELQVYSDALPAKHVHLRIHQELVAGY